MALDLTFPYIAWNNLLKGATYTVRAGTDSLAHPFSNAFNAMMSSVATPKTDSNGVFSVTINISNGVFGYNTMGFNIGPWGGQDAANAFIVGASRHNPANQHWTGGTITINTESHAMVEPANKSILVTFANIVPQNTVSISISGLQPLQTFIVPELFYGNMLQMPYPELGVDPMSDMIDFTTFKAVSGFRYDNIHFVKWQETFHWKYIDTEFAGFIEWFREQVLETMSPFWWVYSPYGNPAPVFVKHTRNTARMPFTMAAYRDFSLKLEEVLL